MSNELIELPKELVVREPENPVHIDVPAVITAVTNIQTAQAAMEETGMIQIDTRVVKMMKELGIVVEDLGISTFLQGSLAASAGCLRRCQNIMEQVAHSAKNGDKKQKATYAVGYLADKIAKTAQTSNRVAESSGALKQGGNGPVQRPSYPPGAVIHAQPGSTVQIGVQQVQPKQT